MDSTVGSPGQDSTTPPVDSGGGTPEDSGSTGPEDAQHHDSATAETGAPDSGGTPDSGPDATVEAGSSPEAGPDAGPEAGPEAGPAEGGTEAGGHEAGGAPTACTQAPCAASGANSVQCVNSPTSDGVCTPTEAAIVARDIANGNLDGTGQLKPYVGNGNTGSCYTCLNTKSCLDDNQMDTGAECADAPSTAGGPAACMATLDCILSTDCQGPGGIAGTSDMTSQENVNLCYCGGANPGSACSAAGLVPTGLCDTQEAAGLGFAVSDNTNVLLNFGTKTLPSGIANHIFQCAASNKCPLCQ
jgi:hypothetical protein